MDIFTIFLAIKQIPFERMTKSSVQTALVVFVSYDQIYFFVCDIRSSCFSYFFFCYLLYTLRSSVTILLSSCTAAAAAAPVYKTVSLWIRCNYVTSLLCVMPPTMLMRLFSSYRLQQRNKFKHALRNPRFMKQYVMGLQHDDE